MTYILRGFQQLQYWRNDSSSIRNIWSLNQSTDRTGPRWHKTPINQSINQSDEGKKSHQRPVSQSINRSNTSSKKQDTNQPINQSINQSDERKAITSTASQSINQSSEDSSNYDRKTETSIKTTAQASYRNLLWVSVEPFFLKTYFAPKTDPHNRSRSIAGAISMED